ncbi:MAG: hypothetical protein COB98_09010 [Flavobacteriaceae bacterium]|nr:MAG: hypothetical protein COB98_09010 [Flavobacteriaceae bacterium]
MKKQSLLGIASFLCKTGQILCIISFMLLCIITIYGKIDPSNAKKIEINFNGKYTHAIFNYSTSYKINDPSTNTVLPDSEVFTFYKLTAFGLILLISQWTLMLLIIFLSLKEFRKLIKSVENISTFQQQNVQAFRTIGKYLIIYFFLSNYSYYGFEQGTQLSYHLDLTSLVIALFAYILAEIFKEGNKLAEENSLTV